MRRLAALVCAAALLAACSAPAPGIRRGAEGRRLYRAALEQQAEAERLMQEGDTAAAIPLLRDAYVGFVDSGHPEAYAPTLVSIWMAEETVHHRSPPMTHRFVCHSPAPCLMPFFRPCIFRFFPSAVTKTTFKAASAPEGPMTGPSGAKTPLNDSDGPDGGPSGALRRMIPTILEA